MLRRNLERSRPNSTVLFLSVIRSLRDYFGADHVYHVQTNAGLLHDLLHTSL